MTSISSYSFIFKRNKLIISLALLKRQFLVLILFFRLFLRLFWKIRTRSWTLWNYPILMQNWRLLTTSSKLSSEMLLDSGTLITLKLESLLLWTSKRRGQIQSSPGCNFSSTHYSWQRAIISQLLPLLLLFQKLLLWALSHVHFSLYHWLKRAFYSDFLLHNSNVP